MIIGTLREKMKKHNNGYAINEKLIVSGNKYDYYKYSSPLWKGYSRKVLPKWGTKSELTEEERRDNRGKSLNRARRDFKNIVNANPDMDKFFTLTFAENITDLKTGNNLFKLFIKRINYYLKKNGLKPMKYAVAIEFQERGAVHYHMICRLPYIPHNVLSDLWGNGFVFINKLDNVDNVGAYVVKYMQEDLADPRLEGNKCYFTSRNLHKPIEITDKFLIQIILKRIKTKREYTATYNSDYCGEITYKQIVADDKIDMRGRIKRLIYINHNKTMLTAV